MGCATVQVYKCLGGQVHMNAQVYRTQNSEILFNIILCYCSLGYIRYKRKVDNAVDM